MIDLPPEYYYAKGRVNYRYQGIAGLGHYFRDLKDNRA